MAAQVASGILVKIKDDAGTPALQTLLGLRTRNIQFNREGVDITNAESSGMWKELLTAAGVKFELDATPGHAYGPAPWSLGSYATAALAIVGGYKPLVGDRCLVVFAGAGIDAGSGTDANTFVSSATEVGALTDAPSATAILVAAAVQFAMLAGK